MAGHFPFAGKRGTRYGLAPRGAIAAFFENQGFNHELQEKYYKGWYDYARDFVTNDSDLSATMGVRFSSYPMGTHARHSFHLNDRFWPVSMDEPGSFISNVILPKLDADAMHTLKKRARLGSTPCARRPRGTPARCRRMSACSGTSDPAGRSAALRTLGTLRG